MADPLRRSDREGTVTELRCPECGSGDLYTTEIARRDRGAWRGVYCAGEYDRDRRKFLRRGCGYADASPRGEPAVLS